MPPARGGYLVGKGGWKSDVDDRNVRGISCHRGDAVSGSNPHESEVLGLVAEGRSNAAIAQRLVISERAVAKHTASIFLRLGLQPSEDDNRRVLAVLAYLGT